MTVPSESSYPVHGDSSIKSNVVKNTEHAVGIKSRNKPSIDEEASGDNRGGAMFQLKINEEARAAVEVG
ncbi:hypothetical protein PVK06_047988 [Gossypium arboreum]|uniref:Uncharacterized protein n=1 Tax=Gossypium arboreum TaxID=29729 RepID=A0ABR0MF14_GOSAR|nr:hypothetical protein PVK06_047988 [Gossypium arboreum]